MKPTDHDKHGKKARVAFVEAIPDQATRNELAGVRRPKSETEVTVDVMIADGYSIFERVGIRLRGMLDRLRTRREKR